MPEHDDLALIVGAAHAAGAIAREYFGGTYKQWNKGKGQPVTEADLAIDRFLREGLTAARPDYGWLSEESIDDAERMTRSKVFVVDPIDGTIAFLKGKPHFSISIAIVERERPVEAAVFNPITNEFFSARLGQGAKLNGMPIRTTMQSEVEGARMLAPNALFEHPFWSNAPNIPWPPMHVEQRNSIAYRLALVAAGQFDATISLSTKHDWDLAAGDLIVHEAGGRVTDHRGLVLRYNGRTPVQRSMVGGGISIHARLVERLEHIELPQ